MAMPGKGCFVAWCDVKAGREADHDHWHTHEHMVERVAIPGFLRGLRYRALDGGPRVCVVYQVESPATFTSPPYLERLDAPTPWTRRMMPDFIGMNRTLCAVDSTHGRGTGGYLLSIQLQPRAGEADRLRAWLSATALPALADRAGLSGAHLLIADRAASETRTQEKILRGEPDAIADWVVLVEAVDRTALEQARAELVGPEGLAAHGAAATVTAGLYSLDFTIDETEAKRIWRAPPA